MYEIICYFLLLLLGESCLLYSKHINELKKYIITENGYNKINTVSKKPSNYTPAMASQVTVMSIDEKKLQKKLNKKQKRNKNEEEIKDLLVYNYILFLRLLFFLLQRG